MERIEREREEQDELAAFIAADHASTIPLKPLRWESCPFNDSALRVVRRHGFAFDRSPNGQTFVTLCGIQIPGKGFGSRRAAVQWALDLAANMDRQAKTIAAKARI
jgi:hypothetical protein